MTAFIPDEIRFARPPIERLLDHRQAHQVLALPDRRA
jgi:hypothetical protein